MTCSAILEATVQVLVQQGADKLTTSRVAERAGVSVGTLYQYYPNKAALIEAVRGDYFRLLSDAVGNVMNGNENQSIEEKLGKALAAVVKVKRDNIALSLALAHVPADSETGDFGGEVIRHFAEVLLAILGNGNAPSETRRAQVYLQVAALEGALGYAVKNEPAWLEQPWFVSSLQAMLSKTEPD